MRTNRYGTACQFVISREDLYSLLAGYLSEEAVYELAVSMGITREGLTRRWLVRSVKATGER